MCIRINVNRCFKHIIRFFTDNFAYDFIGYTAVSYTHLDVYKRQVHKRSVAADGAVCHIRRGGKLSISSFFNNLSEMCIRDRMGRQQMTKLKVYAGENHPHTAQNPEVFDIDVYKRQGIPAPAVCRWR